MNEDVLRICAYMAVSACVLAVVIVFACGLRGGRIPRWRDAFLAAAAISVTGILFGKFGNNFGLPWQVYYSVPAFATIFVPPLVFRMTPWRALIYILLAFGTAPLIHAAFFYLLGWDNYMPFLHLPGFTA